jgi:hypothetical protein
MEVTPAEWLLTGMYTAAILAARSPDMTVAATCSRRTDGG